MASSNNGVISILYSIFFVVLCQQPDETFQFTTFLQILVTVIFSFTFFFRQMLETIYAYLFRNNVCVFLCNIGKWYSVSLSFYLNTFEIHIRHKNAKLKNKMGACGKEKMDTGNICRINNFEYGILPVPV